MDLGSLFLILALVLLAGLLITRPFYDRSLENKKLVARRVAEPGSRSERSERSERYEHQSSALLAERDRVLNALLELDFDNDLGKIPGEDYALQRAALLQAGADALRQLDALEPGSSSRQASAEARLEAVAVGRRANGAARPRPALSDGDADAELEALIAARRRSRQGKSTGFCPKCGKALQASDRFCPGCGTQCAVQS